MSAILLQPRELPADGCQVEATGVDLAIHPLQHGPVLFVSRVLDRGEELAIAIGPADIFRETGTGDIETDGVALPRRGVEDVSSRAKVHRGLWPNGTSARGGTGWCQRRCENP